MQATKYNTSLPLSQKDFDGSQQDDLNLKTDQQAEMNHRGKMRYGFVGFETFRIGNKFKGLLTYAVTKYANLMKQKNTVQEYRVKTYCDHPFEQS